MGGGVAHDYYTDSLLCGGGVAYHYMESLLCGG